jgi:hypothetical protein
MIPVIYTFVMLVGFGVVYLLPTILAVWFRNTAWQEIFIVNVLLGWTIIGYLLMLLVVIHDKRNPSEE